MGLLFGSRDLSSKEWAITALVSQGCTNEEIAAEIEATDQELKAYLERIFEKTGCWNRTEVALWYLRIGVEKEKRFHDRRAGANSDVAERRIGDRRKPVSPAPRANEQHDVYLDE